ncbi:MAG: carbohydrate ABC transporter permease [bacterium]
MARLSKLKKQEMFIGYLCLLPWFLGFIVVTAGPIIASFILSLLKYDMAHPPVFIGFQNYKTMLFEDPLFWKSLKVTSYYTLLVVPLSVIGSLLIALLMNQNLRFMNLFRTIFYLPSVLSGVAVALLWSWVFNRDFGVLNYLLDRIFGIIGPNWLGTEEWVIPALAIMALWGVGGGMVIFLAGLQGIPTQLYEAAEIDGANSWQEFWKITIPLLTPTIFYQLIIGIIGTWQTFTQAYVMTQGGPNYASLFYVLYVYFNAFVWFKMGYACALAWVLFMIILICTILVFKSSSYWVYYEAERR